MGFIITGFIWDIPILIFAYVLFSGPKAQYPSVARNERHRLRGVYCGAPNKNNQQQLTSRVMAQPVDTSVEPPEGPNDP